MKNEVSGNLFRQVQVIFVEALSPFVERAIDKKCGGGGLDLCSIINQRRTAGQHGNRLHQSRSTPPPNLKKRADNSIRWEMTSLLTTIEDFWWDVFAPMLQQQAGVDDREVTGTLNLTKNLILKIKKVRNRYAHDDWQFTDRDIDLFIGLADGLLREMGLQNESSKIAELNPIYREKFNEARRERVKQEFSEAEEMRSSPVPYIFLIDELKRAGESSEIMSKQIDDNSFWIPVRVLARGRIELGELREDDSNVFQVEAGQSSFVKARALLATEFTNDPVFVIRELSIAEGSCKIEGGLTDYFSSLANHDALEHELLSTSLRLSKEGRLSNENLYKKLPLRQEFHKQGPESKRRCAGIGVSTLLAYHTADEGYKLIVRRRSAETAVHTDLYHVIPAGMFQDVWSIQHCVIKEYCEELFRERFDPDREDPEYIFRDWESAGSIRRVIAKGDCELLTSGLVLNLFNMRPEICTVLVFHDEQFFRGQEQKFRPNWEYLSRRKSIVAKKPSVVHLRLKDVQSEFTKAFEGKSQAAWAGQWVPSGLAAFWLGVKTLSEHPKIRETAL